MKKTFSVIFAAGLAAASLLGCVGCTEVSVSHSETSESAGPAHVEIYMPDGAPALALAKAMHRDLEGDEREYHVVDPSTIQTYVTGANPKADLCILPVNLASKLLGKGETYRMLGTVTHGNLYMLSQNSVQYERENLGELIGKTVGVVQLPNVPGLTFKVILNQNNIPWQELGNDGAPAEDKVNLKAVTPEQVSPASGLDCYVAPEPGGKRESK